MRDPRTYIVLVDFEFDPSKEAANVLKHGVGFVAAARIFEGLIVELPDDRRDYGEARVRAIGLAGGRFLTIVYTDRGSRRRIISARRANKKETALWLSSATPPSS